MKIIVAAFLSGLLLTVPSLAEAHGRVHGHHGWHHHRHFHNPSWWVAPAIIGGVATYAVTRPYIVEQPVVVQQPQVVQQTTQVVIDGIVYNRQIMTVNGIQQEVLVRVTQ